MMRRIPPENQSFVGFLGIVPTSKQPTSVIHILVSSGIGRQPSLSGFLIQFRSGWAWGF